jgi:hypothetical protein
MTGSIAYSLFIQFIPGELGFMRLEAGKNLLGIEGEVAWATPASFTVHNYPCSEDGKNCVTQSPGVDTQFYKDPAFDIEQVHERLFADKKTATERRLVRTG